MVRHILLCLDALCPSLSKLVCSLIAWDAAESGIHCRATLWIPAKSCSLSLNPLSLPSARASRTEKTYVRKTTCWHSLYFTICCRQCQCLNLCLIVATVGACRSRSCKGFSTWVSDEYSCSPISHSFGGRTICVSINKTIYFKSIMRSFLSAIVHLWAHITGEILKNLESMQRSAAKR